MADDGTIDKAVDASKGLLGKVFTPVTWTFKQVVLPKHWPRNFLVLGGLALTGGAAGAGGLLGAKALEIAPIAATKFWPAAGQTIAAFGGHAWNGTGFLFGGGWDITTNLIGNEGWGDAFDNMGEAWDALEQGGEQSSIINTNFDSLMHDTNNLNPADMLGENFASASSGAINTTMNATTNPNVVGQIGFDAHQSAHPALTAA